MIKKIKNISILYFFVCVLTGQFFSYAFCSDLNTDSFIAPVCICSPDRPLVFHGESVTLNVITSLPSNEILKYVWEVDVGEINGSGANVVWNLKGVAPGKYFANVQVEGSDLSMGCRLEVRVGLPLNLMGKGNETGRSFLLPDQVEEDGFGLYSYILFGSEPGKNNYQRFLQSIIQYFKFPDAKKLQKYGFNKNELNITYLPLEKRFESKHLLILEGRDYDKYPEIADWVLKHYDYARARALLRNLPGNNSVGPYIISFLEPLGNNTLNPPYLYIDLSQVAPDLVETWIRYFQDQAAQEQFWDAETGKRLALKLRNLIAVTSQGLPDVKAALDSWISWVEKIN